MFKASAEFHSAATNSENVLGIYRKYGDQELLALFNFCSEERSLEIDRSYTDLFTGEYNKNRVIRLKPYGFVWALVKYSPPIEAGASFNPPNLAKDCILRASVSEAMGFL